jgi:hypothetical protein
MIGKKYFKKQIEEKQLKSKTFINDLERYLISVEHSDNTSCLLRISEDEFTIFKISPNNNESNVIPKVILNLKH